MLMKRKEVLRRYRNLRAICTRHHTAAVKFLAQIAIMESARRLGWECPENGGSWRVGRPLVLVGMRLKSATQS
jgi:hypothetical protein